MTEVATATANLHGIVILNRKEMTFLALHAMVLGGHWTVDYPFAEVHVSRMLSHHLLSFSPPPCSVSALRICSTVDSQSTCLMVMDIKDQR
jgi:hypothetical protein